MTAVARFIARPIAAFLAGAVLTAAALVAPASAQMGTQIELTAQSVEGIIASYPELKAAAKDLEAKYHVGKGDDVGSTWGAWLAYGDARARFDGLVQTHGFANFEEWVQTLVSVALAYSFAKNGPEMDAGMQQAVDSIQSNPNLSDAQKKMMIEQIQSSMGAVSALKPSENNLKAVGPYMDAIAKALEI